MRYRIDIIDTRGLRIASFDEVPLVEAIRRTPDQADVIRGILPMNLAKLSEGYRVRVFIADELFCDAPITEVVPQWSDSRKLILDQYVQFQEVIEFFAEGNSKAINAPVARAYANESIGAIVKDILTHAIGPIHYTVAHTAYPDGAEREYLKFLARKFPENELEVGGIAEGQWVGGARIDLTAAYAKDGDTIAGLIVDGAPWPDLRLMMIDCEELSRNTHAIARHPEVAGWTDGQYEASVYRRSAEAARDALQALLDAHGIDYIELNPHRDPSGAFDDRVDAYGRYIGLVFGGARCFNAAQVELGHAEVYLYKDGRYNDASMTLKDFFSYTGPNADSIEEAPTALIAYDTANGVLEELTTLAYAAGGFVWSLSVSHAVRFYRAQRPTHVWFYDPVRMGVAFGADIGGMANAIQFDGNPVSGAVSKTYLRGESIDEYGIAGKSFEHFGVSREEDADKLLAGVLDDIAYPTRSGEIVFFHGQADVEVGDIIEVRGVPLRRIDHELPNEWGGRFSGALVARAREVVHRFSSAHVTTRIRLTSPLRSVTLPLAYMVSSQPSGSAVYQFRLDNAAVGLDGVHHLD